MQFCAKNSLFAPFYTRGLPNIFGKFGVLLKMTELMPVALHTLFLSINAVFCKIQGFLKLATVAPSCAHAKNIAVTSIAPLPPCLNQNWQQRNTNQTAQSLRLVSQNFGNYQNYFRNHFCIVGAFYSLGKSLVRPSGCPVDINFTFSHIKNRRKK